MKRGNWVVLLSLMILLPAFSIPAATVTAAAAAPEPEQVDLTPRLQAIYEARADWLLLETQPKNMESEYHPEVKTALWALQHEQGKLRYMRQWARNRGVTVVEARPAIKVQQLRISADRARFYVAQSLMLGYRYPGEQEVNRFGVGSRHIIELRRHGDNWLISLEWYLDPLGDDDEVPDVTPALLQMPLDFQRELARPATGLARVKGYNRSGAVKYADSYCGLAWGCGNKNRYNSRYRDYNGVGGDCTNFASQALRDGGNLKIPVIARVESLTAYLLRSGRGSVVAKRPFQVLWKQAKAKENGFQSLVRVGDLVAYQEKGKMEHVGIVTGFDTHGYPLTNSHTADRFHVPFDLGWDRKTIYWIIRIRD